MLYTIGHSNHPIGEFIKLLKAQGVTAIADVRSHPYSRFAGHFSREPLQNNLIAAGIAYVFLGKQLGARSPDPGHYRDGQVQFDRLAATPIFQTGLDRVRQGLETHQIALMCAERDALECHRALLVGRHMAKQGTEIAHIRPDGSVETQWNFEERLLAVTKQPSPDMFTPREDLLLKAYAAQAEKFAYRKTVTEQLLTPRS